MTEWHTSSHTVDRNAYLRRCAQISLTKRWYLPVLALIVASGLGLLLLPLWASLLVGLLAASLCAAVIAANSVQRHANDI